MTSGALIEIILNVSHPIEDPINGIVWVPKNSVANLRVANYISHKGAQKMGIKSGVLSV